MTNTINPAVWHDYDLFTEHLRQQYPHVMARSGQFGGVAVGSGWWPLVDTVISYIEDESRRTGQETKILQIKEKFGALRIYTSPWDAPTITGAIHMAELMSRRICESCGAPGETRVPKYGGWVRTMCQLHADNPLGEYHGGIEP